ncbi:UDP-glycosyltransferase 84B2 [Fusarium tjaetaba]|uniref:UDP-glycosyltransferase 84B2 n=1 Tax=Fusarium tjaetaba TaxID=1567544 RepID=A0A8H5VEF7_9HYPO|nr:UDP-glycosyltransferase 84B2 [Fusarium tjaetaba]KAF5621527.1 UDP-glycosyltransferase 84B2 [Fusarium tjaetaba]
MDDLKRILLFTNSDLGQANVVLATAHELGLACEHVEIHIASFPDLRSGVDDASKFMQVTATQQKKKVPRPFVFHEIEGTSWGPATKRPETAIFETLELTPGLVNSAKGVAILQAVMIPWSPGVFLDIYKETERVFDEVKPDLTIVEPLFTQGLTFCHHRGVRWMVLSPNTIKEFAVPVQPNLAALWKYPMQVVPPTADENTLTDPSSACSALPYPIPWSLIPWNICFGFVAGYTLLTDTRLKKTTEILRREIDPSILLMTMMELGVLRPAPPNLPILVASSPDIDYPFSVIPPQLTSCGPIIRAAPPIREVDANLSEWLSQGPTIYVNLGTHHKSNPTEAHEMSQAMRKVLEHADTLQSAGKLVQILWKLGRVPSLYKTRQSPHHGLACRWAKICPRITEHHLFNCYDFANRVELLGIGRWANKQAKPRWEEDELAGALLEVLFGSESAGMRVKAEEVASRHPQWKGRQRATQEILKYLTRLEY